MISIRHEGEAHQQGLNFCWINKPPRSVGIVISLRIKNTGWRFRYRVGISPHFLFSKEHYTWVEDDYKIIPEAFPQIKSNKYIGPQWKLYSMRPPSEGEDNGR